MKKLLFLLVASAIGIMSCQKTPSYKINGTVSDIPNGDTILLQEYKNGEMIKIESAIVKNESFVFKGQQDSVVNRYITYIKGDKRYFVDFFLSNGDINVKLGQQSEVTGTKENDIYQKFKNDFMNVNSELNRLYMKLKTDTTITEAEKEIITKDIQQKDSIGMVMVFKTISSNLDNAIGIFLLPEFANAFDLQKQKELLGKVPAKYSNLPSIIELKKSIAQKSKVSVGEKFIDFTMKTPEGNNLTLSEIVKANKLTLVDFWASWCGPCINEMPFVIDAYKQFNSKGLQIVGISLDNNMNKWKETIERLKMTWPQMSDLKGWDNVGARLYGISSIPSTILIHQEGYIVAKNLRGDALLKKIKEILN